MNAIVTRLIEAMAAQRPSTVNACEHLLAAQLTLGDQDQLRTELERALASRDRLACYLRELQGRVAWPSPCSDPLDDELMARVAQGGLSVLSPGQLARLAVSPMLVLDLWDAIDDDGLSPQWLQVVRSGMQAEEQQRGRKAPTMQDIVASIKWAAGARLLRPEAAARPGEDDWIWRAAGAEGNPHADMASLPARWQQEIRLSQAIWLSREDPSRAARVENATVVLEFSWLVEDPPRLEVRLMSGPLTLPEASCVASLVDHRGQEFAADRAVNDSLVFPSLPRGGPELLAGMHFTCIYTLPGTFQLKIIVPINPGTKRKE